MKPSPKMLLSRFTMEVVTSAAIVCFGLVVCFGARASGTGWGDAGPQAGYFPFYLGIIAIISGAGSLVMAFVKYRDRSKEFLTTEQAKRVFAFFGPMFAFVLVAIFLGLYVATALYLIATMTVQGKYRLHHALLVGVGAAVLFFFVFEVWFQSPLLKGPLEKLLGIY